MRLQQFADLVVTREAAKTRVRFITGMALGWDQAIARACTKAKVPWIAAIPFIGQEKTWPRESQDEYHQLLLSCESQSVICSGGYEPWKMQVRNEWMIDRVGPDGVLMALWNGTPGGTSNAVAYARRREFETVNLWEEWRLFP
jgi:uncharacterized phage-like protein YoqJ